MRTAQAIACTFQSHCDADRIVAPMTVCLQRRIVEIDFDLVCKVGGTDLELAIFTARDGGVGGKIDSRGHYKTRVVIGVLANKIDAPRRATRGQSLCPLPLPPHGPKRGCR